MSVKSELKRKMILDVKNDPDKRSKFKVCGIISIVTAIISLVVALLFMILNPAIYKTFVTDMGFVAIISVFIYIIIAVTIVLAFIIPGIISFVNALIQIGVNRKPISIVALVLSIVTVAFDVYAIIFALQSLGQ